MTDFPPQKQPNALAWAALHGDKDSIIDDVRRYLIGQLNPHSWGEGDTVPVDTMVVWLLCDALDPTADSNMKLLFQERRLGRRFRKLAQARRGYGAAAQVKKLVAARMKKEAAVAAVSEATGLSRSEIFSWLRRARQMSGQKGE